MLLKKDYWIAIGFDTNVVPGTYAFGTLVHEIGHAIGLNHPGNYNAGESKSVDLVGNYLSAAEDTFYNSIESYRQSAQGISGIWFQPYDMLALRYLYGKNNFNVGDTTYTSHPCWRPGPAGSRGWCQLPSMVSSTRSPASSTI